MCKSTASVKLKCCLVVVFKAQWPLHATFLGGAQFGVGSYKCSHPSQLKHFPTVHVEVKKANSNNRNWLG